MKTSLCGTLNKWDTSLSGTLFSVPKPKMNLTKWDTLLFETSPADVFISGKIKGIFGVQVGDNKTNKPDNEDESQKNVREKIMKKQLRVKH